ncbi:MAG: nucleotidyl transferase AbiEii/AbiGii toxin family protein [Gammaproteobacteria bacterium]
MISKDEILSVADETGLTSAVVEKDYVLGWLLAAIHQNAVFSDGWVFKGGTCLKKGYFETYRFSEDLDFTLKDESHLDADLLTAQFLEIAEWHSHKLLLLSRSVRRKSKSAWGTL